MIIIGVELTEFFKDFKKKLKISEFSQNPVQNMLSLNENCCELWLMIIEQIIAEKQKLSELCPKKLN